MYMRTQTIAIGVYPPTHIVLWQLNRTRRIAVLPATRARAARVRPLTPSPLRSRKAQETLPNARNNGRKVFHFCTPGFTRAAEFQDIFRTPACKTQGFCT